MVGSLILVLCIWAASAAMFFRLSSPARTPGTRAWRFAPILTAGFAIPLAAAYGRQDWSTFGSLLVAGLAAFAVLLYLLRPVRL